ncbi:MAG: 3'-5' exonuclease [Candidatus Hodarchaeota archaeon]
MKDLMVDIETLGTGTRGLIIQIGACYFDRYTGNIGDTFLENIQIQDSLNQGFEVRGDTIEWWLNQDKEIIKKMLYNPQPVRNVLEHFKQFCKPGTIAWAHSTFDFPILTNAYHLLGIKQPISYKKMRDIRTLIDLSNLKRDKNKSEKTHNALDDCIYQVKYCTEAFKMLRRIE